MRGVDLLLPNADELHALGGAEAVLRSVGAVASSAGADGASWADRTGRWTVSAPTVDVVDATGAGDAFDAGVLVAWLGGADREAALDARAARPGAAAVGRIGARPTAPCADAAVDNDPRTVRSVSCWSGCSSTTVCSRASMAWWSPR